MVFTSYAPEISPDVSIEDAQTKRAEITRKPHKRMNPAGPVGSVQCGQGCPN